MYPSMTGIVESREGFFDGERDSQGDWWITGSVSIEEPYRRGITVVAFDTLRDTYFELETLSENSEGYLTRRIRAVPNVFSSVTAAVVGHIGTSTEYYCSNCPCHTAPNPGLRP